MTAPLLKQVPPRLLGWLDIAGAGLCALLLLPLGTDALFPLVAMAAWCVWAKVSGISMALVSALVVFSLSLHEAQDLPKAFYGISALGVLPWALGERRSDRAGALVSGLMWTSMALAVPGLLPLVLFGYPRLGKLYPLYKGWTHWPGVLVLGGALVWLLISGEVPEEFSYIGDPDHYQNWASALAHVFQTVTLWSVIPLVGVFEIAQRQAEDLRMTWRSLPVFGMLGCICFLEPEFGIPYFFAVAVPLSSILLMRWGFALHSIWLRRLYWALVIGSAILSIL